MIVFPNVYEKVKEKIRDDNIVAVRGNLQLREDEQPKILAYEIEDIEAYRSPAETSERENVQKAEGHEERIIRLRTAPEKSREEIEQRVGEILHRYPGRRRLEITVGMTGEILHPPAGVRPCDDLYQELYALTGGAESQ